MSRGNWVFVPNDKESGGAALLLFGFIIVGIFSAFLGLLKLATIIMNWQEYTFFNMIIAGIYYFIALLPLLAIISPWFLIYENGFTQYNNLNLVLAIVSIIKLAFVIIKGIFMVSKQLSKLISRKYSITSRRILLIVYLSPILIWISVSLITNCIEWLFARP